MNVNARYPEDRRNCICKSSWTIENLFDKTNNRSCNSNSIPTLFSKYWISQGLHKEDLDLNSIKAFNPSSMYLISKSSLFEKEEIYFSYWRSIEARYNPLPFESASIKPYEIDPIEKLEENNILVDEKARKYISRKKNLIKSINDVINRIRDNYFQEIKSDVELELFVDPELKGNENLQIIIHPNEQLNFEKQMLLWDALTEEFGHFFDREKTENRPVILLKP